MRWPFMLRATHDALLAAKNDRLLEIASDRYSLSAELNSARREHDTFVATLAERALPPAKPVPPAPAPVRPRDKADSAIDFASAFDPRRRRHLEQFVRARRAEGMDADAIAQEVLHPPRDGDGEWEMPE